MGWKIACLVLAVAVAVESTLLVKGVIDDNSEKPVATLPTDAIVTDVTGDTQLQLARRFRPVLRFDSAEAWRPLEVGRFFDEQKQGSYLQRLCNRANLQGGCDPVAGIDGFQDAFRDLALHGANLFVDIDGAEANGLDFASTDPSCASSPPLLDCNRGPRSAIYYNVQGANGRYYVDYWWFYRYNDFPEFDAAQRCEREFRPLCGDHEGDWEGVTVVTSAADPDEVEYVAYAAHNGTARYAASQLDLQGPFDTRPVVYVARGSHASYPKACLGDLPVIRCQQLAAKAHRGLPEGRHDGARPWGRNKGAACDDDPDAPGNSECVQPLPPAVVVGGEESWNAYAGLWGRVCPGGADCPVMRGPSSPGQQPRFESPWCAHPVTPDGATVEEKASCDVLTPGGGAQARPGVATGADCRAWAGVSAAVVACNASTLAGALASSEAEGEDTISILIAGAEVGETDTRGVAQLVAKPIRARANITIRGKVSDVVIRARQPAGRRPKDLVEARFTDVGLGPGEEATARVRYRDGEVRVTLLLPSGKVLTPSP